MLGFGKYLQEIRQTLGLARRVNLHFSLHGPYARDQFTLFLSHLPEFREIINSFEPQTFNDKWLLIFRGPLSKMTEGRLRQFQVAFERLHFQKRQLLLVRDSEINRPALAKACQDCRDWWLLTQTEKPDDKVLEDLGLLAAPGPFQNRHASIGSEILLNYFSDPSIRTASTQQIRTLVEKLFELGFQEIYGPHKTIWPLRQVSILQHLGLSLPPQAQPQETSADSGLPPFIMHSFTISGRKNPRIIRMDWPKGKRWLTNWSPEGWQPLVALAPSRPKTAWQMIGKYLPFVLLAPVALVVLPLTLLIWLGMAFVQAIKNN